MYPIFGFLCKMRGNMIAGWIFVRLLMLLFSKRCLAFLPFAPLRFQLQLKLILKGNHYPKPRGQGLSRPHMRRLISSGVKRVFNYSALDSGITFLAKQQGRRRFLTGSDRFLPTGPRTKAISPHRRSYFKLVS